MGTQNQYDEAWEYVGLVIRYTRNWLHYGLIGHIVVCTLVAAVEGLFTH